MKTFALGLAVTVLSAGAAIAGAHMSASSFQQTCSNIAFAYAGEDAAITAVCLTAAGAPNETSIMIPGISNENGVLTMGEGASSFQQSCGSITVETAVDGVTLSALCRRSDGSSNATSIAIPGIGNNDGNLSM